MDDRILLRIRVFWLSEGRESERFVVASNPATLEALARSIAGDRIGDPDQFMPVVAAIRGVTTDRVIHSDLLHFVATAFVVDAIGSWAHSGPCLVMIQDVHNTIASVACVPGNDLIYLEVM